MFFTLKPAPSKPRLPDDQISSTYKLLREQVFLGTFIGYAGFYLIRKNISFANVDLMRDYGFTKGDLGYVASAIALAYGLSKFVMGNISDRSDARKFLALGLLLTVCVNLFLGLSKFAFTPIHFLSFEISSLYILYAVLFLNGWFGGMGWAPCGRSMVHWFSTSERGTRMAIWNVAHNVGASLLGLIVILGGMIYGDNYQMKIFFLPALFAAGFAAVAFFLMRDTPQSCGLPPIEEYKNEYPEGYNEKFEQEMTAREIFFKYIFRNKFLWYIAVANAFVYLIRYGISDWMPLYLQNVKGYSFDNASLSYSLFESAGIPGTLLCGWISDKFFKGQRAPVSVLFMALVFVFILTYWFAPPESQWMITGSLIAIGFLIYGPVMMIGLHALELVPKKAAGTAAGLTGLFGYFIGTQVAGIGIGNLAEYLGWDSVFILLLGSCVVAGFFIALTWKKTNVEYVDGDS